MVPSLQAGRLQRGDHGGFVPEAARALLACRWGILPCTFGAGRMMGIQLGCGSDAACGKGREAHDRRIYPGSFGVAGQLTDPCF